jgi:hypothetical protein
LPIVANYAIVRANFGALQLLVGVIKQPYQLCPAN